MSLASRYNKFFRAVRDWRFLAREAEAGDLVQLSEAWALEVEDEEFSLLNVWFPNYPRRGTARLVHQSSRYWHLTFWSRQIRLGKDKNTVRPLNFAGRWTAYDLIGQRWMARQMEAMRPPSDDPEHPPPLHPVPPLMSYLARPRGGMETVHAIGGRYQTWLGLLLRRWLHEKTRALLGVPSSGFYIQKGPLVEDCCAILNFTYRGEKRRLRLDQVRRHQNGNIHFLGRQLPGGEQRSFAFQNISALVIEGYGPVKDERLFLDLEAIEENAWRHWLDWNSTATRIGHPLPEPDLATRVVGKAWRQLIRPYWAYMYWRYPKNRMFRKLTLREKIDKRIKPLRSGMKRVIAHIDWLSHEYGPKPVQRRDLTSPDARWRRNMRDVADKLDTGQDVDIRSLRHVATLAKDPMLARKIARHILLEERAGLARTDPAHKLMTEALALSPARRRFIPHREISRAYKLGDNLLRKWNPFEKLYDVPCEPDPTMVVQAYLRALYLSNRWSGTKGYTQPHVWRGEFRVLLLLHLGRPDGRRWLLAGHGAARLRKMACL